MGSLTEVLDKWTFWPAGGARKGHLYNKFQSTRHLSMSLSNQNDELTGEGTDGLTTNITKLSKNLVYIYTKFNRRYTQRADRVMGIESLCFQEERDASRSLRWVENLPHMLYTSTFHTNSVMCRFGYRLPFLNFFSRLLLEYGNIIREHHMVKLILWNSLGLYPHMTIQSNHQK